MSFAKRCPLGSRVRLMYHQNFNNYCLTVSKIAILRQTRSIPQRQLSLRCWYILYTDMHVEVENHSKLLRSKSWLWHFFLNAQWVWYCRCWRTQQQVPSKIHSTPLRFSLLLFSTIRVQGCYRDCKRRECMLRLLQIQHHMRWERSQFRSRFSH